VHENQKEGESCERELFAHILACVGGPSESKFYHTTAAAINQSSQPNERTIYALTYTLRKKRGHTRTSVMTQAIDLPHAKGLSGE
jgi:hypothetical protein